ncbi:hypothetical protein ABIE27_003821 [Paenibacillus sp. 4624]
MRAIQVHHLKLFQAFQAKATRRALFLKQII